MRKIPNSFDATQQRSNLKLSEVARCFCLDQSTGVGSKHRRFFGDTFLHETLRDDTRRYETYTRRYQDTKSLV